jgi:Rer1 family
MEENQAGQKLDFEDAIFLYKRKYRIWMDRIAPMRKERWAAFCVPLAIFIIRMYVKQGYAVLAYLLGLFYLNSVMLYLAPAEDPGDSNEASDFSLPVRE